jgi:hypothetical protein
MSLEQILFQCIFVPFLLIFAVVLLLLSLTAIALPILFIIFGKSLKGVVLFLLSLTIISLPILLFIFGHKKRSGFVWLVYGLAFIFILVVMLIPKKPMIQLKKNMIQLKKKINEELDEVSNNNLMDILNNYQIIIHSLGILLLHMFFYMYKVKRHWGAGMNGTLWSRGQSLFLIIPYNLNIYFLCLFFLIPLHKFIIEYSSDDNNNEEEKSKITKIYFMIVMGCVSLNIAVSLFYEIINACVALKYIENSRIAFFQGLTRVIFIALMVISNYIYIKSNDEQSLLLSYSMIYIYFLYSFLRNTKPLLFGVCKLLIILAFSLYLLSFLIYNISQEENDTNYLKKSKYIQLGLFTTYFTFHHLITIYITIFKKSNTSYKLSPKGMFGELFIILAMMAYLVILPFYTTRGIQAHNPNDTYKLLKLLMN